MQSLRILLLHVRIVYYCIMCLKQCPISEISNINHDIEYMKIHILLRDKSKIKSKKHMNLLKKDSTCIFLSLTLFY